MLAEKPEVIGSLTVLGVTQNRSANGSRIWAFRCACGEMVLRTRRSARISLGLCPKCIQQLKREKRKHRPPCRHCGMPGERPRGLCSVCYYNPGIRSLYLSLAKRSPLCARTNQEVQDCNGNRPLPEEPTDAPPGSDQKIKVMAERASKRQQLFHPHDATMKLTAEELSDKDILKDGRVVAEVWLVYHSWSESNPNSYRVARVHVLCTDGSFLSLPPERLVEIEEETALEEVP